MAKSGVRFVHAVPGAGTAELTVEQAGRTTVVGRAGYAEDTRRRGGFARGAMHWTLRSGGDTVASGDATLGDGNYTVVAMPQGSKLGVGLFRDAARSPRGKARVRVIHASSEFGTPDLMVDGKRVVRKLGFGKVTPYLTLVPGRHDLEAVRSGTRDALLEKSVSIPGDTTTNAIVIGTSGEPARLITVTDTVARRERGATTPTRRARGADAARSVTVARGDSLWTIARERLGAGASSAAISREVQRLWNLNDVRIGTGDPNLIFPGQTLKLS